MGAGTGGRAHARISDGLVADAVSGLQGVLTGAAFARQPELPAASLPCDSADAIVESTTPTEPHDEPVPLHAEVVDLPFGPEVQPYRRTVLRI